MLSVSGRCVLLCGRGEVSHEQRLVVSLEQEDLVLAPEPLLADTV